MLQLLMVQALLGPQQPHTDHHLPHTHTNLFLMEGHTPMLVLEEVAITMSVEDTIPQQSSEEPWELSSVASSLHSFFVLSSQLVAVQDMAQSMKMDIMSITLSRLFRPQLSTRDLTQLVMQLDTKLQVKLHQWLNSSTHTAHLVTPCNTAIGTHIQEQLQSLAMAAERISLLNIGITTASAVSTISAKTVELQEWDDYNFRKYP